MKDGSGEVPDLADAACPDRQAEARSGRARADVRTALGGR